MSKQVQTGVTFNRNDRTPLDNETVMSKYSDIEDRIEKVGHIHTKKGRFYAGFITSVINDEAEKNGPYYISYSKSGQTGSINISYTAHKIVLEEDVLANILGWNATN